MTNNKITFDNNTNSPEDEEGKEVYTEVVELILI